jgi:superfamily II DNA or RNA helicase
VSGARNPNVIEKIGAVFESDWNSGDFVPYDAEEVRARTEAAVEPGPTILLSPIELRPEPFQERLLEQIALARQRGHHRNLLVSATGTGKTVMAAADYARLRETLPRARLLFVAHREEILTQSQARLCGTMRSASPGLAGSVHTVMACRSSTGSITASRPNCACGTRSISTGCPPSCARAPLASPRTSRG